MKINPDNALCVLGLGYVGLPTAALFANAGKVVIGFDKDPEVLNNLSGHCEGIVEPGLKTLLAKTIDRDLFLSDKPDKADVYIVCVPTPVWTNHQPDVHHVQAALESIRDVWQSKFKPLIIIESTLPPGATLELVGRVFPDKKPGEDFNLAYCPERVLPGNALEEIKTNTRIIGGATPECAERAARLYATISSAEPTLTDCKTAEFTKLAENASRMMDIAFANELADLCEQGGADPLRVIVLSNQHPRVNILQPGPGIGGHCIPVDPWFLIDGQTDWTLLRFALLKSLGRPLKIAAKIGGILATSDGKKVVILGGTYKADCPDVRNAPAQTIIKEVGKIADCEMIDPHLSGGALDIQKFQDADLIVGLVAHSAFRGIDPASLAVKQRKVLDVARVLGRPEWEKAGFEFVGREG